MGVSERDASSSGSSSRRVVWKGGLIVKDGDKSKLLQGIVLQSPNPLPLHLSFFPPTPSHSTPSNHITPPVRDTDDPPPAAPLSTPSQHATSSKVTLDTPFEGATAKYETGDLIIDTCLRMKGLPALELDETVVPLADQSGWKPKAHDLEHGVRVIASAASTEAIRHVQTLLIPPKMKQSLTLDAEDRTLRGLVLRSPNPDSTGKPIPPLVLYGIKALSPRDNKPRLLLFIALYVPNMAKPRTGELAFTDVRASAMADLRKRGKAPAVTAGKSSAAAKARRAEESEEERDPAPEPTKKRFKDRSGMGRSALLHHLPPPRPPLQPTASSRSRAVDVKGKGREREPSAEGVYSALTVGKRRKVALDGHADAVVQPVVVQRVAVVPQEPAELSIEQTNRNTLRMQVSTALAAKGLPPDHPEFKSLGGWITRGAGFALRETITTKLLEESDMSEAVACHLESYLPSEFKTARRTTAETASQTEAAVEKGLTSSTLIELEAAVTAELSPQGMDVDPPPSVAADLDVGGQKVSPIEQDAAVDSIGLADQIVIPVALPVPASIKAGTPSVPAPPTSKRTRTRSVAAAASSENIQHSSPTLDADNTPQPAKLAAGDDPTPTKTRSGRARIPPKSKATVSSPLKNQHPALAVAAPEDPETAAAEQELEVPEPMIAVPIVAPAVDSGLSLRQRAALRVKIPIRRTGSGRVVSAFAPRPPADAEVALLDENMLRAAAVLPLTLTAASVANDATPIDVLQSTSIHPPSDHAGPPPSSLPSPSLSQTPTKTTFRRTRSNRSVLSATTPTDAISPSTPVLAEASVITPKTSTKRTRSGAKALEAGEVAPEEDASAQRVTRSRRESVPLSASKEAPSSAFKAKAKAKSKKAVVPETQDVDAPPEIETGSGVSPLLVERPAGPQCLALAPVTETEAMQVEAVVPATEPVVVAVSDEVAGPDVTVVVIQDQPAPVAAVKAAPIVPAAPVAVSPPRGVTCAVDLEDGELEEGEIAETEGGEEFKAVEYVEEVEEVEEGEEIEYGEMIDYYGKMEEVESIGEGGEEVEDEEMGEEGEIVEDAPPMAALAPTATRQSVRDPLSDSSSLANILPVPTSDQTPLSPHLLRVLNLPPAKEDAPSADSPATLSPSLAKLLNVPRSADAHSVSPKLASSPVPSTHILHHPLPIRSSPPALCSVLEEAAERILSPMPSLPAMPPPLSNLQLPSRPEGARKASFDISSLLNPSDAAVSPTMVGPASAEGGKKMHPLPSLPSQADGDETKWTARERRKHSGNAAAAALLSSSAPSKGSSELAGVQVIVSGPTPTKVVNMAAPLSTVAIKSPLATTAKVTLASPNSARQAQSVKPMEPIASLASCTSSSVTMDKSLAKDSEHPDQMACSILGLSGVKPSLTGLATSSDVTSMQGIEVISAQGFEDLFAAESEEEVQKTSLAPGERDPSMYYTDEEAEPLVKKGWY